MQLQLVGSTKRMEMVNIGHNKLKLQLAKILIDKVIVDSFFFGKTVDL